MALELEDEHRRGRQAPARRTAKIMDSHPMLVVLASTPSQLVHEHQHMALLGLRGLGHLLGVEAPPLLVHPTTLLRLAGAMTIFRHRTVVLQLPPPRRRHRDLERTLLPLAQQREQIESHCGITASMPQRLDMTPPRQQRVLQRQHRTEVGMGLMRLHLQLVQGMGRGILTAMRSKASAKLRGLAFSTARTMVFAEISNYVTWG